MREDMVFLNVIVTGGSAGIGSAIVHVFAKAGHRVLFSYHTGLSAAKKLEDTWPNVLAVQLDQGDVHSVAAFASEVDKWSGDYGIDVLINNAGLGSATVEAYVDSPHSSPLVDGKHAENDTNQKRRNGLHSQFAKGQAPLSLPKLPSSAQIMLERARLDEALVRVNALGPLWVTQALMDPINRSAKIKSTTVIFIGSVGGGSSAVFPEYCAADLMSKAAITYLSKHLAAEHHRDNMYIMCVSPGATETEMFRKSTLEKVSDVKAFVDSMPKGRLIQPEDVAQSVYWLSTQKHASIFHGAVLDASMGLAVRPGMQTETDGTR